MLTVEVVWGWGGYARCGVGWVMQDGVRWVIQGWGQGGSYRGGMGWVMKNINHRV